MNVLTVNFLFSILIFGLVARLYVLPRLHQLKPQTVLIPILLFHSTRHLGLMFLSPGATYPAMPAQFAYPAAFGDLLAALLALAALAAVVRNARAGTTLLWIFNVEGTLDFIAAVALNNIYRAQDYMGAAYWIPALWVPALLVTHYITFVILLRDARRIAFAPAPIAPA